MISLDVAGEGQALLHINLGAIVANWRLLCQRHPGGAVAAVLKADAYGLGAAPVARALWEAGCRHFFVAHLAEAVALRAA
jgi:alanine racemase